MLETEIDEKSAQVTGVFEHLGNNLGALSFLIDMLNYQPVLAKKLFVYDEEKNGLRPVMGRSQVALDAASSVTVNNEPLVSEVASAVNNEPLVSEVVPVVSPADDLDNNDIFFDLPDSEPELVSLPADQFLLAPLQEVTAVAESLPAIFDGADCFDASCGGADRSAAGPVCPLLTSFEEDDLQDIFLEEAPVK